MKITKYNIKDYNLQAYIDTLVTDDWRNIEAFGVSHFLQHHNI